MKKFTTLALAGAMSLAMACTAFAASETNYSVTITEAELQDALGADNSTLQITENEDGSVGYGFNIQVGHQAGKVTGTYTLTDGTTGYLTPSWWSSNDATEVNNAALGAWAGAWVQADVPSGSALESITLSIVTDAEPVVDGDEGPETILRYINTQDTTPYVIMAAEATGDVAPVAYLAAAAALAGLALVATKKKLA